MKQLSFLIALIVLFAACKKNPIVKPATGDQLTGKWKINSVTTIARDTAGNITGQYTTPGSYGYYFQFNPDKTWTEALEPAAGGLSASLGTYVLNTATTFTLYYPTGESVPCTISSQTETIMVFTRSRNTLFDGERPGTIENVLMLTKSKQEIYPGRRIQAGKLRKTGRGKAA